MSNTNSINCNSTGVVAYNNSTGVFSASAVTQHDILVGGASNAITSVSPSTSGFVLTSAGVSSDPSFQAPAASSLVTTFNSSGTWNKDSRTKYAQIFIFNGGPGGGSGRKGTSTASGGGGGGSGIAGISFFALSSVLGNSETVTIGALAGGGTAQSSDLTNGNNGTVGNTSGFGNWSLWSNTSTAALGGTATTANAGGANNVQLVQSNFVNSATVNTGGQGRNTAGQSGATITGPTTAFGYYTSTAGGGGGGYDLVTPRAGGSGGGFTKLDGSTVFLAGGTSGTESGTIDGGNGNPTASSGAISTGGTGGGGGGGPSVGTTSGKGGDGAIPAGGGGGGGGGITTVSNSGAGGNGARGQVIVVEFF